MLTALGRGLRVGSLNRRGRLELLGWIVLPSVLLALLELVQAPDRSMPIVFVLALGVLVGGSGLVSTLRRWQQVGGQGEDARMRSAVRTGTLPGDAAPRIWTPELLRRRRSVSGARVAVPVQTLCCAFLVSLRPGGAAGWLVAAVLAVGAAWTAWAFVDARRSLPRLDVMLLQLARRWEALLHPAG